MPTNFSLTVALFFSLLSLSLSRHMTSTSQIDIEALIAPSPDLVTKIDSSYLSLLPPGQYLVQFTDPSPLNPYFDYQNAQYYIYLPVNFTRINKYPLGVIGFLSHTNEWGFWNVYKDIFDERNLIYISPQNVGNMASDLQRKTAWMTSIAYIRKSLPVNAERIYASGLSGGARIACQLCWENATYIAGAISMSGCDYPRKVTLSANSDPSYGFYDAYPLPNDVLATYAKVVIITGPNDFLHDNLNDIYNNGILEDGLTGWLYDIDGMNHEMSDPLTYEQAIKQLDDNPRKCIYPCKDCGLRRNDCTACFASLGMSLYVDTETKTGSCVEFCPEGYYAYNAVCIDECPEGTEASNDGYQDICIENTA